MEMQDVGELVEVIGVQAANKKLEEGWILVATHQRTFPGSDNPFIVYILGKVRERVGGQMQIVDDPFFK